ncbi:hypothetical protein Tco_0364511 [Tanacetum coccineum]
MGVCFVKFQVNVVMLWVKKRNSAHVSTGSVFDGPIRRIHGLGYGVLKVWDGYGPENVNDTTKVSVMGEFLRGESQVPLGKVKEIGSKTIKDDIKSSRQQKFLVLRFFDVKEHQGIDRLGPVVVWMVFPRLDPGSTVLVDPGKTLYRKEAGKKAGCSDGKGRRYEKGGIVAIVEREAHGGLGLRGGLLNGTSVGFIWDREAEVFQVSNDGTAGSLSLRVLWLTRIDQEEVFVVYFFWKEQDRSILFGLPGSRQQKFLVLRFFDVKEQQGIDRYRFLSSSIVRVRDKV